VSYKFLKKERLKSRKTIGSLFKDKQSVGSFPIRFFFTKTQDGYTLQSAFSVSKKYFKKAVDRNYFKRILRECYRIHKSILIEKLDQPHAFMFFYQTKDRISYQEIEEKTIQLFEKFQTKNK